MQKSEILRFERFSGWFDFATFVAAKEAGRKHWALFAPPSSPGVYFFATDLASRLRGESDIYYIGRAKQNLRGRIGKYLYRVNRSAERERYAGWVGSERSPEQGIASLVEHCQPVEIGWIVTETGDVALRIEAELLTAYENEHGQLPPNNRIGGARLSL